MKIRKIWWGIVLAGLVLVSFFGGVAVGVYRLPPYALLQGLKNTLEQDVHEDSSPSISLPLMEEPDLEELPDTVNGLQAILQLIEARNFQTQTEVIDFVREFVYENSIHKADEEFWEYAYDTPRVLDMLYDTYANDAPPPTFTLRPS